MNVCVGGVLFCGWERGERPSAFFVLLASLTLPRAHQLIHTKMQFALDDAWGDDDDAGGASSAAAGTGAAAAAASDEDKNLEHLLARVELQPELLNPPKASLAAVASANAV